MLEAFEPLPPHIIRQIPAFSRDALHIDALRSTLTTDNHTACSLTEPFQLQILALFDVGATNYLSDASFMIEVLF